MLRAAFENPQVYVFSNSRKHILLLDNAPEKVKHDCNCIIIIFKADTVKEKQVRRFEAANEKCSLCCWTTRQTGSSLHTAKH